MRTEKREKQRLHALYGESGHYYFSISQVKNRFALCKECLLFEPRLCLKYKRIYGSLKDIELCSITEYQDLSELTERYERLDNLGFGGEFYSYDKFYCPEGALFPFVRTRGKKNCLPIDTGCIWVGTRFEYPRIFVNNNVAQWVSAYSPSGYARKEPFLPYDKVIDILPMLMNKKRYPDLEIDSIF